MLKMGWSWLCLYRSRGWVKNQPLPWVTFRALPTLQCSDIASIVDAKVSLRKKGPVVRIF
jgi:hypothetical protein